MPRPPTADDVTEFLSLADWAEWCPESFAAAVAEYPGELAEIFTAVLRNRLTNLPKLLRRGLEKRLIDEATGGAKWVAECMAARFPEHVVDPDEDEGDR